MSLALSSSIPTDWLVLQWDNGGFVTVHNQDVLSSLEMLKKGDEISFIWNGEQRKAKYVTHLGGQDTPGVSMLQDHANRQQAARTSGQITNTYEDDSSSFSDWEPLDDTTEDEEEEDSDMDNKKRVKLERCKRQININRSNKRKKATRSLRATLVLRKRVMPRKKTHISSLQNDKRKPKKTLKDQLSDILTDLQTLAKIFEETTVSKVIVPTKYKAGIEDVTENEEANSEHQESSSSDNNVLISNKHTFFKGFSASYPSGPSVSNMSGPYSVSNQSGPLVSNPPGTSVSNPSEPSVSNPSGPSVSKTIKKAENKDQTRYNQSVKEDASEDEEDVAFKLREARAREAITKMINNNLRTSVSNTSISSVSNPSGPSTSKKYKAENTDRNRYNQSVKEDVSKDEEDTTFKLIDARGREAMVTMFEDNLRPSVTNPSRSSISKPSGPSKSSKKYKAKQTDRAHYNQSVEEDVLENEEDEALILRRQHEAMIQVLEESFKHSASNPPRSSIYNPSGPATSKKYKAENSDRARYNQSVEEDVLENEEDMALMLRIQREVMLQMLQENLRQSISNPPRSSVSNPSGPSTSKTYRAENSAQSRHNQSVKEDVSKDEEDTAFKLRDARGREAMATMFEDNLRPSVTNPSRSNNQPVEEDVTEDEEETSEHEEFNSSDDNVLITNKYRNVTVKTVHKDDEWVPIGTGKTQISREKYMKVNWKSYTIATRTLLLAVFPRRVLATHSLTGKKSPAFQDKPAKNCLDPKKTSDVIAEIKKRFRVKESLIRSIITTKCADECKMFKTRLSRNNENVPPSTNGEEEE